MAGSPSPLVPQPDAPTVAPWSWPVAKLVPPAGLVVVVVVGAVVVVVPRTVVVVRGGLGGLPLPLEAPAGAIRATTAAADARARTGKLAASRERRMDGLRGGERSSGGRL